MRTRKQPLDHRAYGLGAEDESFFTSAAIEHAVGEDVTAFEIGPELNLIDSKKGHVEIPRHRLHGRYPVARIGRLDLLLAGNKRDRLGADPVDHLVVDLAGQ